MKQSFFIKTYGCQMNVYDSEKIIELMTSGGYRQSSNPEESDIAIFNTCHIREKAAEKLFSDLGRISKYKENKIKSGSSMKIIVTGCVAQAEGDEIKKRNKSVDLIFGPQNYQNITDALEGKNEKYVYSDFLCEDKFESLPIRNSHEISRLVTIQEGCDKFCSFCVVPYTRGAEFSRPVEGIFLEVKKLVEMGAKEVILLGQNVSSYNSNVFEEGIRVSVKLSKLCNLISNITGLERIRYLTSHPNDIENDLINEHYTNKKLMPFLHLPIQSGSDKILKRMNRNHSRNDYINLVRNIKSKINNMAFSSDFIVGYPGETEYDFDQTIDLIEHVGFASSYSFKYSPRAGTQSSLKHLNVVNDNVSDLRLKKIQELLNKQQSEFNLKFIDKNEEVLFTDKGKKNNQFVGRTKYLQPVHVLCNRNIIGKKLEVNLESLTSFSFHGKIIN